MISGGSINKDLVSKKLRLKNFDGDCLKCSKDSHYRPASQFTQLFSISKNSDPEWFFNGHYRLFEYGLFCADGCTIWTWSISVHTPSRNRPVKHRIQCNRTSHRTTCKQQLKNFLWGCRTRLVLSCLGRMWPQSGHFCSICHWRGVTVPDIKTLRSVLSDLQLWGGHVLNSHNLWRCELRDLQLNAERSFLRTVPFQLRDAIVDFEMNIKSLQRSRYTSLSDSRQCILCFCKDPWCPRLVRRRDGKEIHCLLQKQSCDLSIAECQLWCK